MRIDIHAINPAPPTGPQNDARARCQRRVAGGAPRLAVVIERAGLPRRISPLPWLRSRYGIEQLSTITLPARLWQAAAEGSGLAEALLDRLALSLRCRPGLIIVLGRAGPDDDAEAARAERERVRRIVVQLRNWNIPLSAVGLWMVERGHPGCPAESREPVHSPPDRSSRTRSVGAGSRDRAHQAEQEVQSCG